MKRKTKPIKDDRPQLWEVCVSRERWLRHRAWLMARETPGCRPNEWWRYEKNMESPQRQPRVLYELGELSPAELEQCMAWWRTAYDEAHQRDEAREDYYLWNEIPPKFIAQWDDERRATIRQLKP
jgi:hypothetical protein